MIIEKGKENLVNEYNIVVDNEDFLIITPFAHESSIKIIDLFRQELEMNEIPEWFDSCLCAQSCSFFNLMFFTYRATLYYVVVRSKQIKKQLKDSLKITHPAFIFGITIPHNEWEINQLKRSGFSQLDSKKWISSDHTFTVHGRTPPKIALDLDILNVLGLTSNDLEYISVERKRIKSHYNASADIVSSYKGGDLNLSTRPIEPSCFETCKNITGTLSLQFSDITSLPDCLCVDGDLLVQHTKLERLPDNLRVGGKINISKTNVTELPVNFVVNGSLLMMECKVKRLPQNMKVYGNLNLENSLIEYIPEDLYVEGSMNIESTPLAKTVKDQDLTKLFPNVQNVIYV